jgi:hypothetical protein
MQTIFESSMALWLWPFEAAKLARAYWETAFGAQRVISARLPMIRTAFQDPLSADHRELSRMVVEKVDAFHMSGNAIAAVGKALKTTGSTNAQAYGRLTGGALLWPVEWLRLFESNLATIALLAALPGTALGPIHRRVTANDQRLGSSGRAPKGLSNRRAPGKRS